MCNKHRLPLFCAVHRQACVRFATSRYSCYSVMCQETQASLFSWIGKPKGCMGCWRPGYRPKLRAELESGIAANLRTLQAEREALLKGDQAVPAT